MHCPLGVDFVQAVGEMGKSRLHAMFAIHVFVKPRRVESLRMLVVGLRCTISRMFSCSSMFCLRARSDETCALGSVPHSRNVLRTLENTTILNSAHRKPPAVFFNRSSGTTIAEALNMQHISIFGMCEDVRDFSKQSYNITINSHNSQLTLHTDSHASVAQQGGREGNYRAPKPNHYTVKWLYLGNRSE